MITHTLIKMKDTGLYSKAIERWNVLLVQDRARWADFCTFMIGQYELIMLTQQEQEGPTIAKQGYDGAFNAAHEDASITNNSTSTIIIR